MKLFKKWLNYIETYKPKNLMQVWFGKHYLGVVVLAIILYFIWRCVS